MNTIKAAALAATGLLLGACGSSGINCDNSTTKSCTVATWPGVMSPSPVCTNGATSVGSCAGGAVNTCSYTDSKSFPSTVTYTVNFYSGADIAAAMAFCTSVSGTFK